MEKEFERHNYWALVLGGSSGLGLATAKKLAQHGMNICIVHRNSRMQETNINNEFEVIKAYGVKFKSFNLDAFKKEKQHVVLDDLKNTFDQTDKIRALVYSVAKGNLKPMVSKDLPILQHDDFKLTINAMAIGLYDWVQALFQANMFAKDSRIISFTSEGNSKAWKNYGAVSAAKATLEAITRNLALELAPFGIKANCIQAGVTDTASLRMIPGSDEIIKHTLKRNPNKRLTLPKDVANAVYLLCKDEAAWINGTIIKVDGGESLS